MLGMTTPQALVDRIQREFVLGGHKAAAIAGLLTDVDVYLVSELPDEAVRSMCMHPFADVDRAVAAALVRYGERARFLVVPNGSRVVAHAAGRSGSPGVTPCSRHIVRPLRCSGH